MHHIRYRLGAGLAAAVLAAPMALAVPGHADTLRIVPQADLQNTDPVWTTAAITQNHGYMIHDMLFALDGELQPQPQMVDSWEVSDDGLVWTFTLREGLTFHDGTPVTAAAAAASIERWSAKRPDGGAMMERAESLEATGDLTFELRLTEPFGPTLLTLANPSLPLPVMREQDAAVSPDEQVTSNIGAGPFRFVADEWQPGNVVVYAPYEDYVARDEPASGFAGGKQTHFERVEWQYIPDTNTATNALISGEVDVYEIPPLDLLPLLEGSGEVTVQVLDPLGKVGHIRPNFLHPPFNDVRARQALQLLVDQKEFLAAMVGNNPDLQRECYAIFLCGSPFETDVGAGPWTSPDPERARELLAEAGYDGEPIVVMTPTDQQIIGNNMMVMVQKLRDIGVNVDLQSMDWSSLTSRRPLKDDPNQPGSSGWHLFPTWWTGHPMTSPVTNSPLVAQGDRPATWFGWPEDEEIEQYRAEFIAAGTYDEQMEAVRKLQERFYEFIPYINTGQFLTPVAWRNDIVDVADALLFVAWNVRRD